VFSVSVSVFRFHRFREVHLPTEQTLTQASVQAPIEPVHPTSMYTDHISNSAIWSNDYALLLSALCACVQVKNDITNEAIAVE